jgi:hypothetical protein
MQVGNIKVGEILYIKAEAFRVHKIVDGGLFCTLLNDDGPGHDWFSFEYLNRLINESRVYR